MPRVSLATFEKACRAVALAGAAETRILFGGERDPVHLRIHRIAAGAMMAIVAGRADHVLHVWRGTVRARGAALDSGSSLIVEHEATVAIVAIEESLLLDFASAGPSPAAGQGGGVHLLPSALVPRMTSPAGGSGVAGGMHADGTCPGCGVWLHENSFPGTNHVRTRENAEAGVHSHEEDEVIFVTDGEIRLGARLFGPGTALAIAAGTLYAFTPGPSGLRFVNFRPAQPREIRFADGTVMDEVGYWRDRVAPLRYLEQAAA